MDFLPAHELGTLSVLGNLWQALKPLKNVTSVTSMSVIYSIMMVWSQIKYLSTKAFKLGQSFRHSGAIILCWSKKWLARSYKKKFSRWQGIDSRGEKQKKKTWSRSSYIWKSGKASEDPANHCLGGKFWFRKRAKEKSQDNLEIGKEKEHW